MKTTTSRVQIQKEDWYNPKFVPMGTVQGARRTTNKTRAHTKQAGQRRLSLAMAGFKNLVFVWHKEVGFRRGWLFGREEKKEAEGIPLLSPGKV